MMKKAFMTKFTRSVVSWTLTALPLFAVGCGKTDEPQPDAKECERTVLVYAVGSNSLSSYLDMDINEMHDGVAGVDLDKSHLLIYKVQLEDESAQRLPSEPELVIMERSGSGTRLRTLKKYDNAIPSTDPGRISQVLEDVRRLSPAQSYGLIFWSHSDAWRPSSSWTPDPMKSFGQHWDGTRYHYCETPDLADAVPDGMADFIWFDSCYMANIETAYEFRGKCRYFVGSVLELNAYGMPYDITLPYLLDPHGDVAQAARLCFEYYNALRSPVSMSVMDMEAIEPLAEATRDMYEGFSPLSDGVSLQCYSRSISPRLFDFGQYTLAVGKDRPLEVRRKFEEALDGFVIYKGISTRDFNNNVLNPDNYSGLSCHSYQKRNTREEEMYRTLSWFHTVYPTEL